MGLLSQLAALPQVTHRGLEAQGVPGDTHTHTRIHTRSCRNARTLPHALQVHLIASADHCYAPLLWGPAEAARFRCAAPTCSGRFVCICVCYCSGKPQPRARVANMAFLG